MRRLIKGDGPLEAMGPFVPGVIAGGLVFLSGQVGEPFGPDGQARSVEDQTSEALDRIGGILAAGGCSLEDLVSVSVYLREIEDFDAMNTAYIARLGDSACARTTVEAKLARPEYAVEISAVAAVPQNSSA